MMDGVDWPTWWQWWLLIAITVNTTINIVVFFKHRFKKQTKFPKRQYHKTKQGRPEIKVNTEKFYNDVKKGLTIRALADRYNISIGKAHSLCQTIAATEENKEKENRHGRTE